MWLADVHVTCYAPLVPAAVLNGDVRYVSYCIGKNELSKNVAALISALICTCVTQNLQRGRTFSSVNLYLRTMGAALGTT